MKNFPEHIGVHLNISHGFEKTCQYAKDLKIKSFQIFTKNNRQWQMGCMETLQIQQLQQAREYYQIKNIFSHASYLINLCSEKEDVIKKSKLALAAELLRCDQLNIEWTVLHPGSSNGNANDFIQLICDGILTATENSKAGILLENSAGQGSSFPRQIEELAQLFKLIKKRTDKIGVCIDTCHAWAAGYELHTQEGNEKFWNLVDKEISFQNLKLIHCNDSLKGRGTRVDRHAKLSEGLMGVEFIKYIASHEKLRKIPLILEVPYEKIEENLTSLKILENLF